MMIFFFVALITLVHAQNPANIKDISESQAKLLELTSARLKDLKALTTTIGARFVRFVSGIVHKDEFFVSRAATPTAAAVWRRRPSRFPARRCAFVDNFSTGARTLRARR